jgi:hypothetical protein
MLKHDQGSPKIGRGPTLTQKLMFLWQDGARMEGKGARGGRC